MPTDPTAPRRPRRRSLWHDRRGIAAIILGLLALPMIGLVGLAIDYSFAVRSQSMLNSAADSAAIVASHTAANAFQAGSSVSDAMSQGQAAGLEAFNAQLINLPSITMGPAITTCAAGSGNVCVAMSQSSSGGQTTFTAQVNYNATYASFFGRLFKVSTFPISGGSTAQISSYAYVNVTFLLDNSSSMLIAATSSGVSTLQPIAANASCFQAAGGYNSHTKAGTPTCTGSTSCTQGSIQIPGFTSSYSYNINGLGGCQCAFACHWVQPSGSTTFTYNGVQTESGATNPGGNQTYSLDYYGLARANGVQLRFDVVQSAVETAINYMYNTELNAGLNNGAGVTGQFGAQVFEFGNALTQDWPPTTDSGTQLYNDMSCLNATTGGCSNNALAIAQSISSPVTNDNANTNFPLAMSTLYTTACTQMLNAGLVTGSCAWPVPTPGPTVTTADGSTPQKAKRSLIIITDGIQDWGGRNYVPSYSLSAGDAANASGAEGPISAADCAAIKSLGYTVYVLYTTYITSPATVVLNNTQLVPYVSGVGEPSADTGYDLTANLNGCATSTSDVTQASSPTDITTALQNMVKAAINGGAVLTK